MKFNNKLKPIKTKPSQDLILGLKPDEFMERFLTTLDEEGDEYFGEPDIEQIKSVLGKQGYYSGNYARYFPDIKTNSFRVEPREFGKSSPTIAPEELEAIRKAIGYKAR